MVGQSTSKANETQVGGSHYQTGGIEHWDVVNIFNLDYFQGNITKYVFRHKKKNGIEDLKKAQHYLQKYIEILEERETQERIRQNMEQSAAMNVDKPRDPSACPDCSGLLGAHRAWCPRCY